MPEFIKVRVGLNCVQVPFRESMAVHPGHLHHNLPGIPILLTPQRTTLIFLLFIPVLLPVHDMSFLADWVLRKLKWSQLNYRYTGKVCYLSPTYMYTTT